MSYVNHYDLWSNYYQHCGQQLQDDQQMKQSKQQDNSKQDNPRVKDLIDKALAKQCAKSSDDKNVTPIEMVKTDEDVEEGQIVCSPKQLYREHDSDSTPSKASSPMTPLDSSVTRNSSKSHSRSPSKARLLKSRSRSRSRRYHSHSRSRSRTPSRVRRRRSRSRSRSPYLGPIIKDYRRGRRAYIRYPRGYRVNIRPYRRAHYSSNYHLSYGFSRRNEFSRSRSRSFSPKRRQSRSPAETEKIALNDEKPSDGKHSENLKPSDIKISQKKITQSFLAMLEEKQSKSKMVPIMSNKSCEMTEGDEAFNKQHGFVNTFNTVREIDGQKHTLSYDLEREGWQVIDDASSESGHRRRHKTSKESVYRYESTVAKNSERGQYVSEDKQISQHQRDVDDSSSSEEETKKKKKKTKKRKKRKKRKSSTSNESSISESDEDIGDEEIGKKKNKKKKKTSKKKKKKVNSPSSSDNEEKETKHKKKKKKKKKAVSSDTDSKEKVDETVGVLVTAQMLTEDGEEKKDVVNELLRDVVKIKDKKKKRKAESSSTDSDSDKNVKKKKKKSKKKRAKKRKHHSSSSSSSSESSDSSESFQKKKKRKKSKKSKRTKKHKKEKKSDKKEKTKLSNDENKKSMNDEDIKQSEFVTVYSIGEPSLEIKWPKNLINFTSFEPSLQFSINPKVIYSAEDFLTLDDKRKCSVDLLQRKDNEKLASEYERFIDELKPAVDFSGVINEQSLALEVKMREKLLKQMGDNCKQTSEEQNLVTPSEKRAMEKMKKQYQKISDEQEAQRRHEELKSAPLSTYYSVKRQNKSSDHENEDFGKSADSSSKLKESSDVFCKTDDISIAIVDRTNKQEDKHGFDYGSKVEDKKKTARELLERVKQKKSSGKESNDDTKSSKRSLHIGKIKKPPKKDSSKKSASSTTGSITDSTQKTPFVSKPMKLDINYDYNWYYQYYRNNYGLGQYPSNITSAAAYYAQYALITSYDYSHQDLSNWMHSKGYLLENAPKSKEINISLNKKTEETLNSHKDDIKLPENSTEPKIETTKPEMIPDGSSEIKLETEKIDANELIIECNQTQSIESKDNESKSESFGKISDLNASHTTDNNLNMQQNIEVIVSSVHNNMTLKHLNNTDKSENDCAPNMSPFCSANMKHKVKVRVTTNSQSELSGETCVSPTPPPPPPKRPKMTTFTSMNAITLPNGQVLPAGTKQIVVHPYQYPYSNRFSAEWYYNAFEAHNTAKTAAIDTQSIIAN